MNRRLYIIPPSENEHCLHNVDDDISDESAPDSSLVMHYPRGGHNYYGRDIEKLGRQMGWVEKALESGDDWKEAYRERREAWEKIWSEKIR